MFFCLMINVKYIQSYIHRYLDSNYFKMFKSSYSSYLDVLTLLDIVFFEQGSKKPLESNWLLPEVLEGSSGEDEVEDEIFGRFFPRTRRGKEFFPFPRPF